MNSLFYTLSPLLTSYTTSILLAPLFIRFFQKNFENSARAFTPQNHQIKGKTPTMGGVFIICAILINTILFSTLLNQDTILVLITLLLFAGIGLFDDISKIAYKKGISAGTKWRLQIICALLIACALTYLHQGQFHILHSLMLIAWFSFIIIGSSNGVNLTDGLDGLAAGNLIINFIFFGAVAYFKGLIQTAMLCSIMTGSLLGFLWFNTFPALIFMGDIGSLAFGACLATTAISVGAELALACTGGIFVIETLSVIGQIFWIKKYKKRLIKMAPLHHHFELSGWSETTITLRSYIVTCLLTALTVIILYSI